MEGCTGPRMMVMFVERKLLKVGIGMVFAVAHGPPKSLIGFHMPNYFHSGASLSQGWRICVV